MTYSAGFPGCIFWLRDTVVANKPRPDNNEAHGKTPCGTTVLETESYWFNSSVRGAVLVCLCQLLGVGLVLER